MYLRAKDILHVVFVLDGGVLALLLLLLLGLVRRLLAEQRHLGAYKL